MPEQQQSGQERTEQPTQQRLDKAHREGKVARSQELSGAVILLSGTAALAFTGSTFIGKHLVLLVQEQAHWLAVAALDESTVVVLLRLAGRETLAALLPFLIGVTAVALLVNLIQARGVFSMEPITPKWSKVSPLSGFRKMFSWQSPFTLLKAVLKLGFLTLVTYTTIRSAWPDIIGLSRYGSAGVLLVLRQLMLKLALITGLSFLAIALLDYLFQVQQHVRGLRMTKQDIVREHKESEGDPLIKSRMRALARSLSRKRMLADVANADVVVTNPTHLAVALKYDPSVAPAPMVLAMGQRKLAERIKETALAAGVPLLENQPLAQALVATATVGRTVPPALYTVVAEIIAFVYRQRQRMPDWLTSQGGGRA